MTSLQCTLASEETQTTYEFRPDETKKSAFWLDDVEEKGVVREVAAPAECRIECATSAAAQELYVGGFQVVSNAKMIEVYLNDDQYLTTCRGIPSGEHRPEKGSDGITPTPTTYYKAVFAVPGGPRSVRNVVLKLRSLAPKDQQVARLVMMKLTARLAPDAADSSQRVTDSSSSATTPEDGASLPTSPGAQASPVPAPSLTTSSFATASSSHPAEAGRSSDVDVQAAMMGLSLMLKGTEERVVRSTADKVCRELKPCFAAIQAQLQSLASTMTNQLVPIHTAMAQQQQLIEAQQAMLLQLTEQQSELKQLLLQRQGESTATQTAETALGGVAPSVVESETDGVVLDCGNSVGDDDDADGEVDIEESAQHQEDVDPTPMANASIFASDSAESHCLETDDPPVSSMDDVLTGAFPVLPSTEGAAESHMPPAQAAAPMTMRALDLMDAADDDPFGECAIGPSPPTTSP